MSEKIIEENIVKQTNEDLTAYAVYVARKQKLYLHSIMISLKLLKGKQLRLHQLLVK